MAKYDNKKFYWLQLKEDFFEDDAIQWLEEQKPNGRDYAYFYLKLCLKSLKSDGILVRKIGNILIPYDNKKLSELTKMDFDTVCVAMELLKKIGLVTVLETGEIYINQLQDLIGSKSIGAFKKQQQRALRGQKVDKCPPKINIDLDLDIDIDIYNNIVNEIVNYLNLKTGKHFKPNSENTKKHINARLKEGYVLEDFKKVIDIKCNDWLNNNEMNKYLCPDTLFGTKFEKYYNQTYKELTTKDLASKIDFSDVL